MESLHLGIASSRTALLFAPSSFKGCVQPVGERRLGCSRVLVRARRGEGDDGKRFVGDAERVEEMRRPLWKRGLGFVGRKLGFGEEWEEDPGGARDLEELDLFLEGRGGPFRWKDVLDPSVENILALVLTGLFLYATVSIGWQLLLVAAAITLSALKYAVIAAVLLGVLIFFL